MSHSTVYVGGTIDATCSARPLTRRVPLCGNVRAANAEHRSAAACQGFRTTNPASTTTLQWDAFKCGKDNNADGDVDDGGDFVFADYNFERFPVAASRRAELRCDDAYLLNMWSLLRRLGS